MPKEAIIAQTLPVPLASCPRCLATPFDPFLRGQVVRTFFLPWKWRRRDVWALICYSCKEIVAYEAIDLCDSAMHPTEGTGS